MLEFTFEVPVHASEAGPLIEEIVLFLLLVGCAALSRNIFLAGLNLTSLLLNNEGPLGPSHQHFRGLFDRFPKLGLLLRELSSSFWLHFATT